MKTISTIIACAALIILTGCNSSETKPSETPDTNAPAAQAEAAANQVVDAAAAAAPTPPKN